MASLHFWVQIGKTTYPASMKIVTALTAVTLACLPATLLAEGKGNNDWAEKAARGYEEKAKWAEKEGKPRAAAIYRRMAGIKREAGQASKSGKKFSWDEYHALEGKLNAIKKGHHQKAGNKDCDKPHDKEKAGEGFVRAAEEYRKKAMMARQNGDTDKADIYRQLAGMKMAAANAAKDGKGYDWTAYKELQKKLHGGNKECDKPKHDQAGHDKAAPAKLNIE